MNSSASPIQHMKIIRYYRDDRPWDFQQVKSPSWLEIEPAIRRMDNYCFPIVQLIRDKDYKNDDSFNIVGGEGQFALFHLLGEWQYEDSGGGDGEVRLWASDQGYLCKERNILIDIEKVLRIAKVFYETGYYDLLDEIK